MVDKASKLTKLGYVFSKKAKRVEEVLIAKMMPFKDFAFTITAYNGKYFLKRKRFDEISDIEIQLVEGLLNNRPRKALQHETPLEVVNRLSIQTPLVALRG